MSTLLLSNQLSNCVDVKEFTNNAQCRRYPTVIRETQHNTIHLSLSLCLCLSVSLSLVLCARTHKHARLQTRVAEASGSDCMGRKGWLIRLFVSASQINIETKWKSGRGSYSRPEENRDEEKTTQTYTETQTDRRANRQTNASILFQQEGSRYIIICE